MCERKDIEAIKAVAVENDDINGEFEFTVFEDEGRAQVYLTINTEDGRADFPFVTGQPSADALEEIITIATKALAAVRVDIANLTGD